MRVLKTSWVLAVVVTALVITPGRAAMVSLNASDTIGTSSFNSAGHWNNAAVPSAGNDYSTGDFILRTPADGASYTFAGDSLTVNNTNGYAQGLLYKGTGNTGVITVGDLILNGGFVSHGNGTGDVFQIDGNINVLSDSSIYAKQGAINVLAKISGSAKITNPGSDGAGRILTLLSPANTFTGSIVNNGRFALADDAVLNFVIGANGVNNSVSGTGAETTFDGDFVFDLSGASSNVGDSWLIASAANQSFGATFHVPGFTESGDVWSNGVYRFSESTGELSVIPEPSTLAILMFAIPLATAATRRRSS